MALLRLPTNMTTRQTKARVAEDNKSLSKRVPKNVETDQELSLRIFDLFSRYKHSLITTEEELLRFLGKSKRIGLDTETSGLSFYKDSIAGFSVGTSEECAYIPLFHIQGENYKGDIDHLYDILKGSDIDGFNWKFDKHFMTKIDSRFSCLNAKSDAYLIARLLNNNLDAGLKPLYKLYVDPTVEDYSFSSLFSRPFNTYDPALVYPYAAVDAQKHTILAQVLEEKLKAFPDLYRLYTNLELPLTEVVGRMERNGIQLDKDRIFSLHEELEKESEEILSEIRNYAGQDFNPGSPKQVKDVFHNLGIAELTSTKEEVIASLVGVHPLPNLILKYRGVKKLSSTYTTGLLEFSEDSGVAHPVFNQLGTDTGRFSSTRFNAQNIPKDNRFRNLFIPRPGNLLVSVDYSQQEVRLLAALAGDQVMIDAFRSGKDFYAVMASIAFNLPYESCTKQGEHSEYRQHMKSIVLGLNYDMGMNSLAKNLGKSVQEAQDIYGQFQKTCPGVDVFKKKCRDFAYSHGYAETVLKRRRYFEGVGYKALGLPRFESSDSEVLAVLQKISGDRWAVRRLLDDIKKENLDRVRRKEDPIYVKDREQIAFSEDRQCTNSVIQGSAADMTKLAMVAFDKDPVANELGAFIVLQVHDEIIIECPAKNAEAAGNRLAFIMNGVGSELMNGLPAGGVPQIMDRWFKD